MTGIGGGTPLLVAGLLHLAALVRRRWRRARGRCWGRRVLAVGLPTCPCAVLGGLCAPQWVLGGMRPMAILVPAPCWTGVLWALPGLGLGGPVCPSGGGLGGGRGWVVWFPALVAFWGGLLVGEVSHVGVPSPSGLRGGWGSFFSFSVSLPSSRSCRSSSP